MPDREQADVGDDVLQPVEKEDHADQEQQVVVAGHHVLGAQVQKRPDGASLQPLEEHGVLPGHAVRVESYRQDADKKEGHTPNAQLPIPKANATGADILHGSCHTSC